MSLVVNKTTEFEKYSVRADLLDVACENDWSIEYILTSLRSMEERCTGR